MARVENSKMDEDELREIIEEINLLRKYPKLAVNHMAEHIDEVLSGNVKGFIAGTFDNVLPVEGKEVLKDCMLDGMK